MTLVGVKIILALFICNAVLVCSADDDGELRQVSVIFRHGARTTYSFYPNDPHKDTTFYPFGFGGLTNVGKLGEYKLGEYLKQLYGEFLGEDYTEDLVYVRSTDVTRTKMSAQLVLAALFPPSSILTWNENLLWQPIPVVYVSDADEDLFHRSASQCPYKNEIINNLPNDEQVQETYIKPFQELYDYVETNSGKSMKVPSDMQDLYFILRCEREWNLTLPEWTDSVYPDKVENAASYVYGYHNYDARVRQINSGFMAKKILDHMKQRIDHTLSPSDRKIYLYSGHESTVGYMLNALNLDQQEVPPYGSAISFELRKKDDAYFVKLRYRNDTEGEEPIDLTLPGCELLCPYEKFVDILDYLLPTNSIDEACKID